MLRRAGNVLFCRTKENQKSASDFDALDPRTRGCSPLVTPKQKSKRKNASRFAKRIFSFLRFEGPSAAAAADAVCRYDSSREKTKKKSPQAFLFCKLKIIFPL
jgi:hypothetical protein